MGPKPQNEFPKCLMRAQGSQLVPALVIQDLTLGGHGALLRDTGSQARYTDCSHKFESPPIKIFAETSVRSRFLKNKPRIKS